MVAQIPTLPPVPKPPHDPFHLLLDARAGWRESKLDHVEERPADGSLWLSPKLGSARPLVDAAGTFGGLELPTGIAADGAGSIYLLDAASGKIKRFDPCECRFDEIPCVGGIGPRPRQFQNAHGMAIAGGNLFVCDTGNHRVQVFALKGVTLRALWPSPAAAKLAQPWQPYSMVFDACGRAFVSDFANGVIHRFAQGGRWQIQFGRLTQPTHLAVSCDGRVYVVQSGNPDVAIFDLDGKELGTVTWADRIAAGFCSTGIATDSAGNLYLAERCTVHRFRRCNEEGGVHSTGSTSLLSDASTIAFDLHGNLLVLSPTQKKVLQLPPVAFEKEGIYWSQPLDSELYRCQWHSITLEGEIPPGSRVGVETFTAETPIDLLDLKNLSATAWNTQQRVTALTAGGAWDCLITSESGRFLYLRLSFRGNGMVSPRLDRIKVSFPRISLRRYLPAVFGENAVSASFTDRLLAIFDTGFRGVEQKLDSFAHYLDPMSTPAVRDRRTQSDFLTWLASWMGVILERSWDERRRRLFLRNAYLFHQLRGTLEGMRRQLLLYLGWTSMPPRLGEKQCPRCAPPVLILEHFKLRRWLFVGEARLGEQSMLWGQRIVNRTQLDQTAQVGGTQLIATDDPLRDPFHVYAHKFSVFIPAACARDDERRAVVDRLINLAKPAHTIHQLELVAPRFRIGVQSTIGLDSVVGRYPHGFKLDDNEQRLGYGTVLASEKAQAPTLRVGTRSRIGTTTFLD
jgi:phage tail-like protein